MCVWSDWTERGASFGVVSAASDSTSCRGHRHFRTILTSETMVWPDNDSDWTERGASFGVVAVASDSTSCRVKCIRIYNFK